MERAFYAVQDMFQSAPCTEVQGDAGPRIRPKVIQAFQSAPCTEVQGDFLKITGNTRSTSVSIRSLHRSTGRLSTIVFTVRDNDGFNPLPAPKYREMKEIARPHHRNFSFNPLPAPKYREIKPKTSFNRWMMVSIRSLHRSTGRYLVFKLYVYVFVVSIRSLHRSTGRCAGMWGADRENRVSIRSLHRSTGRCAGMWGADRENRVSIRSLHRSTGRSMQANVIAFMDDGFNPLPAPKYREMRRYVGC